MSVGHDESAGPLVIFISSSVVSLREDRPQIVRELVLGEQSIELLRATSPSFPVEPLFGRTAFPLAVACGGHGQSDSTAETSCLG